jgi:hypothetical protein
MQWKDASGRDWVARCTIGLAMELKESGIDLMNPRQLAEIYKDPFKFLELGVKLHRVQMQEDGVSDSDMLELMTASAEVAEAAVKAVEEALVDFFHRIHGGKALAAVMRRAVEAATRTEQAQIAMIGGDKAGSAIDRLVSQAIQPLESELDRIGSQQKTGETSAG